MRTVRGTRLAASTVLASLLASAAVVSLPTSASAATLCQSDCIGAITVSAGPEQARLQFATTANARVSVEVKRADGVGPTHVMGGQSSEYVNAHDVTTPASLAQATVYRYTVTATDYLGGTREEVAYFTTAQRDVTVDLDKLVIDDDSDTGSAGDLVGGAQLQPACGPVVPLAPLSLTATSQRSTGDVVTMQSASTMTCWQVPATVDVRSQVVDDDREGDEECDGASLPWGSKWDNGMGSGGSSNCADWNSAGVDVASPLPPSMAVGTASTSFLAKTSDKPPFGMYHVPLEYRLSGTATFSHWVPVLPKPVGWGGTLSTKPTTFGTDKALSLSWVPVSIPGVPVTGYRVRHRPVGGAWTSFDTAAVNYATISGLTNGTTYEVKVYALDSAKATYALGETTGTPKAAVLPSEITGWSTSQATLPVGNPLVSSIDVSTSGTGRSVLLQRRADGSDTWTTEKSYTTTADGTLAVAWHVTQGWNHLRLLVPATATHGAVTSASRLVVATSSLSGFPGGSVSQPTGTQLTHQLTVSPGGQRDLQVQTRPAGTPTWTTHATVTTDAAGKATVTVPVLDGAHEWVVRTSAHPAYGSEAVSPVSTVTGAVAAASTVTGWDTTKVVEPVGTTVTDTVAVTTAGTARQLHVQYRKAGSPTWVTRELVMTSTTGAATLTFPVMTGSVAWRVHAPATASHAAVTSASRSTQAQTTVTGYATTATTVAAGTSVKDAITVTPGANRTVKVQYRKAFTTTWVTHQTLVTSSTGTTTVTLKAFPGAHAWRVHVPATSTHGTAFTTPSRSIKGQ